MRRSCGRSWIATAAMLSASGSMRSAFAGGPDVSSTDDVVVHGAAGSSASGFVSKASEADAPREITDVASLLEPLPGVHVRRLGADDTFSTLSIRGSTSSEVAVVFAGVPLTGAADPSLDLSSLPLWPGARVKVYRSFTPAAVGSGSLGGTLVLEPPRPTDAEGTLVWAGVGSFGEERLRLADVRAVDDGRARLVTALSASRATDDFSYYDVTHSTPKTTVYTTRQNAGFAAINGFTALALPLDLGGGEPGTVTVTALAQSRLQHVPGSAVAPTLFADLATNRELLSFDVTKPTSATGAAHLVFWTRRDEIASHDAATALNSGYADIALSTDDVIVGAGGAASWRGEVAKNISLEVRADGSFERFAPGDDVSEFGTQPSATRASVGGGGDLDWHPLRRWTLTASGRADVNVDGADAIASGATESAGATSAQPAQGTDLRPTGHLGSEVLVGPVTLAAHGGALARAPSFLERYGGGGFLSNSTLRPESALTADLGARYATDTSARHRWRAQIELDGFATHADDLITLVPIGAFARLKAENVSAARIYGVETSASARGYGIELRAAYTGLITFNDDPSVAPASTASSSRPPLFGRPAHDFVGDVAYTLGPIRARYGVDFVAGLYADAVGQIAIPDRLLQSAGLRLSVPWVRTLRLAFDVSNLANVRTGVSPGLIPTREPIGDQFDYPLPGRTFLFTARWSPGAMEDAP
jgi:hypothetical protein